MNGLNRRMASRTAMGRNLSVLSLDDGRPLLCVFGDVSVRGARLEMVNPERQGDIWPGRRMVVDVACGGRIGQIVDGAACRIVWEERMLFGVSWEGRHELPDPPSSDCPRACRELMERLKRPPINGQYDRQARETLRKDIHGCIARARR